MFVDFFRFPPPLPASLLPRYGQVLSVIAQQILSIMAAIKARKTSFVFMDSIIRCNWNCGIFITMNPGV